MAAQLLSGVLAGIVGLGSVTLYLAAFFFPEVHRRHDFFWSGVGCFYALVLWLDASQTTPTELVGHLAGISLLGWLGWQTLTLRRKRTPLAQQTPYTADSWPTFRREMAGLALDALRQTPLRQWVPDPTPEPVQGPGIRVSALKDVGYEFVDSVEPPDAMVLPRRSGTIGGTEAQPPSLRPRTTRVPQSPSPQSPSPQSPSLQTTVAPSSAAPSAANRLEVAPSPPPRAKGMSWGQRIQGLVTWGQEVVRSKTTPKPKKPVIEIPPRPSSLAKRSPSPAPSPPNSPTVVQSKAVQPPLAPMPPAEPPAATPDSLDATPAESPQPPAPATDPETTSATNTQSAPGASPATRSPQAMPEASNWDDEDDDWI